MEIKGMTKGRTFKSAFVTGADDKETALLRVCKAFGETKTSLFGWAVMPVAYDEDTNKVVTLKVVLYTD